MSLRKISPGVYISVVPKYMEASFESMCDAFTGLWKHPSTKPVDGRALAREESLTESDDYHPKSSPGSHSPCPHDRTDCKGPCLTYTFKGPPRSGPPPSRPDPCIPKGHVVVMVPGVLPKSISSPCACPKDSNGHVLIVMPEEQEEQDGGPGNCPPATDASEPPRSPRSTSPQPTSSVHNPPEAGSAPSSLSSGACSSETAWVVAAASAPGEELKGGQAAEQSSAAECVLCGNHFKMPAWDEHAGPPPPNPQPWPNQPRPRPGLPSKHEQPVTPHRFSA